MPAASDSARRYARAQFSDSVAATAHLPADTGREVAFAGRSNAGKSSALNAITGRRGLARTSKTPGRTRLINLFDLGDDRRLVDLPGYGYARVGREVRENWQRLLVSYLAARGALAGTVLVTDCRRGLTDLDWQLVALVTEAGCPLHVLLTKADKLSRGAGERTLHAMVAELERAGVDATLQLFSSTRGLGLEDARGVLDAWLGFDPG